METVLEVRELRKAFRDDTRQGKVRTVLDGIGFSIREGECLGVVGRSGCGKSTLARVIARLLPADAGEILLCGEDITHARGRKLREAYGKIQMIFQMPEDSFDPRQTLGWSIGEAMRNRGWDSARIEERTDALLRETGLSPAYKRRYPHEVSGGECQRAAIARAVAIFPRLLLCDEATSALDVTVQMQVVRLLRRVTREAGIACLFITHDLALLPQMADRILVMHEGRVVEEGETERLLRAPRSPYTRELLEADFFG